MSGQKKQTARIRERTEREREHYGSCWKRFRGIIFFFFCGLSYDNLIINENLGWLFNRGWSIGLSGSVLEWCLWGGRGTSWAIKPLPRAVSSSNNDRIRCPQGDLHGEPADRALSKLLASTKTVRGKSTRSEGPMTEERMQMVDKDT